MKKIDLSEVRQERLIRKWTRLLVEQGDTKRALARLDRKDGRHEK